MESWLKKDLQRAPGIRRMTALQLVDKSAHPALAAGVHRRQVVDAGVGEEEVGGGAYSWHPWSVTRPHQRFNKLFSGPYMNSYEIICFFVVIDVGDPVLIVGAVARQIAPHSPILTRGALNSAWIDVIV